MERKGKRQAWRRRGASATSDEGILKFSYGRQDLIKKALRFERKRKLQELGLIIDGFPFDKTWDETASKEGT